MGITSRVWSPNTAMTVLTTLDTLLTLQRGEIMYMVIWSEAHKIQMVIGGMGPSLGDKNVQFVIGEGVSLGHTMQITHHSVPCELLADAKSLYEKLIKDVSLFDISICSVIQSTEYEGNQP